MIAGEEDLMVVLHDVSLVDEDELRHQGARLQLTLTIQVGYVADDQVPAVDRHGISALDQSAEVVIMTDQLAKH